MHRIKFESIVKMPSDADSQPFGNYCRHDDYTSTWQTVIVRANYKSWHVTGQISIIWPQQTSAIVRCMSLWKPPVCITVPYPERLRWYELLYPIPRVDYWHVTYQDVRMLNTDIPGRMIGLDSVESKTNEPFGASDGEAQYPQRLSRSLRVERAAAEWDAKPFFPPGGCLCWRPPGGPSEDRRRMATREEYRYDFFDPPKMLLEYRYQAWRWNGTIAGSEEEVQYLQLVVWSPTVNCAAVTPLATVKRKTLNSPKSRCSCSKIDDDRRPVPCILQETAT
jgi:hypothetical protein